MRRRTTKQELQQICRFCHPPDQDRIILKTRNFYIMLSLGPIVEGHLLIVSNEHFECCAELQGEIAKEFDVIVEKVKSILNHEYRTVLLFEHGRSSSCLWSLSPDKHCFHAHMHCVPTDVNLTTIVEQRFSPISLGSWDDFRRIYQNQFRGYLYIEHNNQKKMFLVNKKLRRQYLRYKLATTLEVEKLADWLKVPGWRKIWKAKKRLNPYFIDLGDGVK